MRPLRIAQVAPLYESVPPHGYGGTERVIAALCDAMVAAGHDVTLFAAATSRTSARLVPLVPEGLRLTMTRWELENLAPHAHLDALGGVYARAAEFDVIHAHTDLWTLPFARRCATPTVVTLHGRLDLPEVRHVLARYPDIPFVSISAHQRLAVADLDVRWAATSPNGLDLETYFRQPVGHGPHVAFLGRITAEKRPDWAAEVARRAGRPLKVAAKVDPVDIDYWRTEIEPVFTAHDVEFLGELDEAHKPAFLAGAAALVFPIDWPEPFGLAMIEALAAGTPVVALRRGSVPEIVVDGVSGFICDDLDGMVAALDRVDHIDPEACRAQARRFSGSRMAERYLHLFDDLVTSGQPRSARFPMLGTADV